MDRNYTANGLNQYTAAGSASFAYDANGNLTSDGSTSFTYDAENRLVSASGAKNATLRAACPELVSGIRWAACTRYRAPAAPSASSTMAMRW